MAYNIFILPRGRNGLKQELQHSLQNKLAAVEAKIISITSKCGGTLVTNATSFEPVCHMRRLLKSPTKMTFGLMAMFGVLTWSLLVSAGLLMFQRVL